MRKTVNFSMVMKKVSKRAKFAIKGYFTITKRKELCTNFIWFMISTNKFVDSVRGFEGSKKKEFWRVWNFKNEKLQRIKSE